MTEPMLRLIHATDCPILGKSMHEECGCLERALRPVYDDARRKAADAIDVESDNSAECSAFSGYSPDFWQGMAYAADFIRQERP